jgi:multiple sugar transport system permease protein
MKNFWLTCQKKGKQAWLFLKGKLWPRLKKAAVVCYRAIVVAFTWLTHATNERRAPLATAAIVALLVLFGFVYVYPFLYMIAYSFMDESDVVNPLVHYIPTHLVISNYVSAIKTLNYGKNLWMSLLVAFVPSFLQCVSCSLIAYALSRFHFPGKKILVGLILVTFIVPSQITMIPTVITLTNLKIIDTLWSYVALAGSGQGLRSAIFILIFYQFFNQIPRSIEESAKIDGANPFIIFAKIGIPTAKPAYLLTFLLSFVWYYNETTLTSIYLGNDFTTLVIQLLSFKSTYEALYSGANVNEAIYMAGTLMTILPLVAIYFVCQRFFVEGIDKAGITGE